MSPFRTRLLLEPLEDRLTPAPAQVYVNPAFTGPPGSDPDGPGPATAVGFDAFPTIQQGLDAVATGGAVNVAAGTYPEHLTVSRSVVLQGAVLQGGSGVTVLAGDGTGIGVNVTTAAGVFVDGFAVKGYFAGLVAGPATSFLSLSDVALTGNRFGGDVRGVASLRVAGGTGAHTFFVTPTALAQAGGDALAYTAVGSLTVAADALVNGIPTAGTLSLAVFLNDTNAADTVWLGAAGVARDRAKFVLFWRAGGGSFGGGVNVVLGNGPETVVVQGQLAGAPTAVYAEAGDDAFFVAVTAASGYAGLTLDGGEGFDTAGVFDQPQAGPPASGGALRALPDGTLEFDVAYPAGSVSRIHEQNVEQTRSNVPASP